MKDLLGQPFDLEVRDLTEVGIAGGERCAEPLGERSGNAVGLGDADRGFDLGGGEGEILALAYHQ